MLVRIANREDPDQTASLVFFFFGRQLLFKNNQKLTLCTFSLKFNNFEKVYPNFQNMPAKKALHIIFIYKRASMRENLSSGVYEQQRHSAVQPAHPCSLISAFVIP